MVVGRATGHGDGIGDVRRCGRRGQAEEGLNGGLHLRLAGPTVARHVFLDVRGAVTAKFSADPVDGGEKHAAGMAHLDGGARMPVVSIELLDANHGRSPLGEDFLKIIT